MIQKILFKRWGYFWARPFATLVWAKTRPKKLFSPTKNIRHLSW
ncbi:MAG: hypothetical protein NZ455_06105 [Bacteroidia bacterium]|nr:hypothetical protein [Bacteroidia bacterium]MDW8345954.1 hypothetical protein [Bacteroidia bacterium]